MAGNLKRQNPDLDEDMVLIRAMRDSNLPKFLQKDLPLFQAIIQDLFPSAKIPETKHPELEAVLDEQIQSLTLEKIQIIKQKTL